METQIHSDTDKQRVRLLLNKFTLGTLALWLTAVLFVLTFVVVFIWPEFFPQDQHFLIIPLLSLWLFLLRHYPARLMQLKQDITQGAIAEVSGLSIIHNKPGFKILFAPDVQLSVGNMSFDLLSYAPAHLHIGHQVKVRYLSHSKLLLSVQLASNPHQVNKPQTQLSDIELAILKLMASGEPDKIIARQLSLEPTTVRTYNTNIYRKLAVKNRKQAAAKAADIGLINVN